MKKKETYLIYFKSGSSDEYVMKTKDPSCKEWMANDFVKKYIPSEYEGCDDDEFIYLKFDIYTLEINEVIINLDNNTFYEFGLDDLKEYDVAYDINQLDIEWFDNESDCG